MLLQLMRSKGNFDATIVNTGQLRRKRETDIVKVIRELRLGAAGLGSGTGQAPQRGIYSSTKAMAAREDDI